MKIITHTGGAHFDEFLACCIIASQENVEQVQRVSSNGVTTHMLDDRDKWVVDVGGVHCPLTHNFDHHQLNSPEISAFSLVLNYYHLLGTAKAAFNWVKFCAVLDNKGVWSGSEYLGIPRHLVYSDPIAEALIHRFGELTSIRTDATLGTSKVPLLELMKEIGGTIVKTIVQAGVESNEVEEFSSLLTFDTPSGKFKAVITMANRVERGLRVYCYNHPSVAITVAPDPRGSGLSLFCVDFNDGTDVLNFTQVRQQDAVSWVSDDGSLAKTTKMLKESDIMDLINKAVIQ